VGTANEQIRVSGWVKEILDRQRREGESYNDVLERMLEEKSDRDLLAGFGRWSDEHADRVREARKERTEQSKERMRQLSNDEWRSSTSKSIGVDDPGDAVGLANYLALKTRDSTVLIDSAIDTDRQLSPAKRPDAITAALEPSHRTG